MKSWPRPQRALAPWALLLMWACAFSTLAHDSITTESRKVYLARLQETQALLQTANLPASARARASYLLGSTLDEIRELFNQDIISHGAVKGLESTVLLAELGRTGFRMEMSPTIKLYLSQLNYYRDAIKLDGKAAFSDHARYLLLKNHFYDSFTDNPLAPISQTREELAEFLLTGEQLLKSRDALVNAEEVRFILAIHCLQAIPQQLLSKEEGMKRFRRLQADLRKEFPQSLKPLTLEALASGI